MAQSAITKGASVLVIDPLDSGMGAHIERTPRTAWRVIDYDRLTLGGTRAFYVSFNNVKVGQLMGQGLVSCISELGRQDPEPDRDEGRADRQQRDAVRPGLRRRARHVLRLRQVQERQRPGRRLGPADCAVEFQQQYTAHKDINAALIPNDENGAPIIHYLQGQGVKAKTFPTTGQDAIMTGLQNVLTDYQCGTVYKPIYLQARGGRRARAVRARPG